MIGRIVSTKSKKGATVLVERSAIHPLYRKTFIRTKKYLVWDEIGVKEGDVVEIVETRPISKRKHWKIVKVLGKRLAELASEQMKEKAKKIIAEVMPEEKAEESSSKNQELGKEKNKSKRKNKEVKIKRS